MEKIIKTIGHDGAISEREMTLQEIAALEATRPVPLQADVKAEAQRRILALYPQWKQINAALGLYDPATVEAMRTYINAVRAASDAIEARLAIDPYLDPSNQPDWP